MRRVLADGFADVLRVPIPHRARTASNSAAESNRPRIEAISRSAVRWVGLGRRVAIDLCEHQLAIDRAGQASRGRDRRRRPAASRPSSRAAVTSLSVMTRPATHRARTRSIVSGAGRARRGAARARQAAAAARISRAGVPELDPSERLTEADEPCRPASRPAGTLTLTPIVDP